MLNANSAYVKGLVSVIIPTYKRASLIGRAIESVLNQSYSNLECIVVNDNIKGDEDSQALYNIVSKYTTDKRFIFVEQEKHINGAAARNAGIRVAKGEFISFLDDDDFWKKDKLSYQIDFLNSHNEEWGGVTCLSMLVNNGTLVRASVPFKGGYLLKKILYRRIGLGTGPTLLRRTAIDLSGYFDESLKRHQDLQFYSFFASKFKIGVIKKHLCVIDNQSAINRPNVDEIVKIKSDYYNSISDVLSMLTKRQLKRFYIMHNFELAYAYYSNGRKKDAFKCALGVLKSPATLYYAIERIVIRRIERIFRKSLIKRY